MVRIALATIFFVSAGLFATGQDGHVKGGLTIRLTLPPDTPSESFRINYFMTGLFGGYGGFVATKKNQFTYDIRAAVNGKPADRVKLIAYAPGCRIETFDFTIQGQSVSQEILCVPLAQTIVRGQIVAVPISQRTLEVEVKYIALWDHQFFGIMDGIVTTIPLTSGIVDQNGNFEVIVPDFGAQADLGEAELSFTLIESKTGNLIGFLSSAGNTHGLQNLKVQAVYPSLIRFSFIPRVTPDPQLSSAAKP